MSSPSKNHVTTTGGSVLSQHQRHRTTNRTKRQNLQVYAVANNMQAPSFSVVGELELDRYRSVSCPPPEIPPELERRQLLRDMSNQREASWPNTIEALRQKKLAERREKMEEAERRRCQIDAEEENLRAMMRETVLARANEQLMRNTPAVRQLESQLKLHSVLNERAQQVAMKQAITAQKNDRDRELDAHAQTTFVNQWASEDDQRVLRSKQFEQEVKTEQLRLLEEAKDRRRAEIRAEIEEKERIRKDAEEGARLEREKVARARRAAEMNAAEIMRTNLEAKQRQTPTKGGGGYDADDDQTPNAKFMERKRQQQQEMALKKKAKQSAALLAQAQRFEHLEELYQAKQYEMEELERRREAEGVLGIDSKMLRDDDHRQELSRRNRDDMLVMRREQEERQRERRAMNGGRDNRIRQAIQYNLELQLEEEAEAKAAARLEAQRHQHFLRLQAREKGEAKIRARVVELEERLALDDHRRQEQLEYQEYVAAQMKRLPALPSNSTHHRSGKADQYSDGGVDSDVHGLSASSPEKQHQQRRGSPSSTLSSRVGVVPASTSPSRFYQYPDKVYGAPLDAKEALNTCHRKLLVGAMKYE